MSESEHNYQAGNPMLRDLSIASALLIDTLAQHWSTGQGTKVRHIVWSLYTCSHLVNLGNACSGLDLKIAKALATTITARLILGAEVEPIFSEILEKSGEFARFDEMEKATPDHLPVAYPPTAVDAKALRAIAEACERMAKVRKQH